MTIWMRLDDQFVLFYLVAKRKGPVTSLSAIPNPNLIFITETGGP